MPATRTWHEAVSEAKARFGEADPERLRNFISRQVGVEPGVEIIQHEFLTEGSGISNGIMFFTALIDNGTGPRAEELVLRYMAGTSLMRQRRISDEYHTLLALRGTGLEAPQVLWLDAEGSELGYPGFIMKRVRGEAPSSQIYSRGPLAEASVAERKAMMLDVARFHGRLRRAEIGADRAPHLLQRGQGRTAIEKELHWYLTEAGYNCAAESAEMTLIRDVHNWLANNQPDVRPASLTHGDANLWNIMFRNRTITAALDWELSYLGHQEADLAKVCIGTRLMKQGDIDVDGTPTDEEFVEAFEAAAGAPAEHLPYFRLFSVFKSLVGGVWARQFVPDWELYWSQVTAEVASAWPLAKAHAASHR